LLWTRGELSGLLKHDAGDGDEVEVGKGAGVARVVRHQAPKAGSPSEGSFYDPASPQQDKAALGLGQLDDLQRGWNGEVLRLAFAIDTHDGEIIVWQASTGGINGEMVRDLMLACVEQRFGSLRAPHPVQ
jgi:transposase InsO family protein